MSDKVFSSFLKVILKHKLMILMSLVVSIGIAFTFQYLNYFILGTTPLNVLTLNGIMVLATPVGVWGVTFLALLFEAFYSNNPSIIRIARDDTNTLKQDLYYLFLKTSGLSLLIGFIFLFFVPLFWHKFLYQYREVNLLANIPALLQFAIIWLINSLCFYLHHRLMHTKYFWHLHKIHHSSTDMNIINGFRNHPIDASTATIFYLIPSILLGAEPIVVYLFLFTDGFYQSITHSHVKWKSRFWCWLFVSPQGHHFHHSKDPLQNTKMLGTLAIWDKIFGTWVDNVTEVEIGVTDKSFNSDSPYNEMIDTFYTWVKILKIQFYKLIKIK
jgi:sterol desaturase/sphingolipid hydroxylase (fatty acid hydroxylase superfamily)